jgi:hypothetical protein
MRGASVLAVISLVVGGLVIGAAAQAGDTYVKGNDTGGIIAWSCEAEEAAQDIAATHCARFDKGHRITGVHRQYGDYISFQCLWNPRFARYAIPRVRTRSVCHSHAHTVRVRY